MHWCYSFQQPQLTTLDLAASPLTFTIQIRVYHHRSLPNFSPFLPCPLLMKITPYKSPNSHYLYAERLAASLNEPLDQLLHRALIEKLNEIGTAHTQERAKRGSREDFLAALRKAPDVPPDAGDEFDSTCKV